MSVTEIEKMIIETPEGGPDIFLENPIRSCSSKSCNKNSATVKNSANPLYGGKIWVEDSWYDGVFVQGHYIYFHNHNKEETSCDRLPE